MVAASGHRAFYLVYKSRLGLVRKYRIGNAEDFSFAEAKKRAEALRGLVAEGHDPFEEDKTERRTAAERVSLREYFNYYLGAKRESLDTKTAQAYGQTRDALPRGFVDSPAEDVTPPTFRDALR
jgi:hypothetical protein